MGLNGFKNYQGALNDDPALNTLDLLLKQFPEGYKRDIVLAAADVNTGEWHQFTNENTLFSDLHQAALSSGSIPGIFPPQKWNGTAYMDGGTIWNINIDAGIENCLAKGYDESHIIVDISICFNEVVDTEPAASKNALHNYMENLHVGRFYHGITSTMQEMAAYPDVNFRYYMMNTDSADGFKMLNFNTSVTWPLQQCGMAAAEAVLAQPAGTGFTVLKNWQENVEGVQSKFKHFGDYYDHHFKQ